MNIEKLRQSNSQQINADDILGSPITVTITGAVEGTSEQTLFISVAEVQGKTYRPSLTMMKVLGAVWGDETDDWIGKRLTLYRNPDIKFGGVVVGGIEISAMSDIERPVEVSVLEKRGKRKTFTVKPLPAMVRRDWLAELALAADNPDAIGALGKAASDAGAPAATIAAIRDAWNKAKEGQA
jgi:hypothetical protein